MVVKVGFINNGLSGKAGGPILNHKGGRKNLDKTFTDLEACIEYVGPQSRLYVVSFIALAPNIIELSKILKRLKDKGCKIWMPDWRNEKKNYIKFPDRDCKLVHGYARMLSDKKNRILTRSPVPCSKNPRTGHPNFNSFSDVASTGEDLLLFIKNNAAYGMWFNDIKLHIGHVNEEEMAREIRDNSMFDRIKHGTVRDHHIRVEAFIKRLIDHEKSALSIKSKPEPVQTWKPVVNGESEFKTSVLSRFLSQGDEIKVQAAEIKELKVAVKVLEATVKGLEGLEARLGTVLADYEKHTTDAAGKRAREVVEEMFN